MTTKSFCFIFTLVNENFRVVGLYEIFWFLPNSKAFSFCALETFMCPVIQFTCSHKKCDSVLKVHVVVISVAPVLEQLCDVLYGIDW